MIGCSMTGSTMTGYSMTRFSVTVFSIVGFCGNHSNGRGSVIVRPSDLSDFYDSSPLTREINQRLRRRSQSEMASAYQISEDAKPDHKAVGATPLHSLNLPHSCTHKCT